MSIVRDIGSSVIDDIKKSLGKDWNKLTQEEADTIRAAATLGASLAVQKAAGHDVKDSHVNNVLGPIEMFLPSGRKNIDKVFSKIKKELKTGLGAKFESASKLFS